MYQLTDHHVLGARNAQTYVLRGDLYVSGVSSKTQWLWIWMYNVSTDQTTLNKGTSFTEKKKAIYPKFMFNLWKLPYFLCETFSNENDNIVFK